MFVDFAVVMVIDVELVFGAIIGCDPINETVLMLHVVYDVTLMPYSMMYWRSFMSDWMAFFFKLYATFN